MRQVLVRRDDNWKKLQQYVLDEQERAEVRGPGETLVWGEKREYTWYLRDGYFVRKVLVGRQCFRPIEVSVRYADLRGTEIGREVVGGTSVE